MKRIIILFTSLSLSITEATAQTDWLEGARAGAMGGAYTAISDDADGIFHNPAGLVYAPQTLILSFGMQNLFSSGLPLQNNLGNEGAILASHLSVVYNRLVRPNRTAPMLVWASAAPPVQEPAAHVLAPTSNIFSIGAMAGFLRTGLLDQFTLSAFISKGFFEKSAANAETNHLPHWLSVSLSAKVLGLQYDHDLVDQAQVNNQDELFAIQEFFAAHGRSQVSAGMDLGCMAAIHPRAQLAFAWTNVLQPNLALAEQAPAPRRERLGAAVLLHRRQQWLLALDAEHDGALSAWRFYAGTETGVLQIPAEILRLRLGANHNWIAAGFRLAKPPLLELNYAFTFPAFFAAEQPEGFYNHRFTLSLFLPGHDGKQ